MQLATVCLRNKKTCSNKACNAGVISVYSCLLFFPYQTVGTKLMAVYTFYASAAAAAVFYSVVGAYIAVCSWKKGKKGKKQNRYRIKALNENRKSVGGCRLLHKKERQRNGRRRFIFFKTLLYGPSVY